MFDDFEYMGETGLDGYVHYMQAFEATETDSDEFDENDDYEDSDEFDEDDDYEDSDEFDEDDDYEDSDEFDEDDDYEDSDEFDEDDDYEDSDELDEDGEFDESEGDEWEWDEDKTDDMNWQEYAVRSDFSPSVASVSAEEAEPSQEKPAALVSQIPIPEQPTEEDYENAKEKCLKELGLFSLLAFIFIVWPLQIVYDAVCTWLPRYQKDAGAMFWSIVLIVILLLVVGIALLVTIEVFVQAIRWIRKYRSAYRRANGLSKRRKGR